MSDVARTVVKKQLANNWRFAIPLLFSISIAHASAANLSAAEDSWQDVERIVAVGDIHGDYENYIQVLRNAGLINRRGNWIAGATHFVQLGDLPDRGPDTHKIIQHMKKLEAQASKDGGKVHALIGNHEAMNILGDLRYVDAGEYKALRSRQARSLRNRFYQQTVQRLLEFDPEAVVDASHRGAFDALYPLGYVEHRIAWSPEGEFGSWVAAHNTVIKINRLLFLHGGIGPEVLGQSISEINNQVRSELQGNVGEEFGLSESETGPLWYRGLARNDELVELAHVDAVLAFYDVDQVVIGHTPGMGAVIPRFGAKVLAIDTGISEYYGGFLGSLLIESGRLATIHNGQEIAIPVGEQDVLPYLKSLLETQANLINLQNLITALEESPAEETVVGNPAVEEH